MKPVYAACGKCGLREARHELERRGIVIRFCDECYWNEIEEAHPAAPPERWATEASASRREPR